MMKNISFLIIDDSETDRYLLKRTLEKIDLITDICEVENGRDGLELLKKETDKDNGKFPSIIFLDVNMPIMTGLEFLELYKVLRDSSSPESLISRVVLLSSSENEVDKSKACSYDFVNSYLIKGSLSPKEVREKVLRILSEEDEL